MKKKCIIIVNLICILLLTMLCINSQAKSKINMESDKSNVNKGEEFKISIDAGNSNIAAYTIWLYFDNEKVQCTSQLDNLNVLDNRIIYTWVSDTGKNKSLPKILELDFKSKENGIASFSIIGEFYNEKGEQLDIEYGSLDVNIGEGNNVETQSELNENVSDDNANLEIMRLGIEGIEPDFDANIQEYYLIVDENTDNIDVTAIPENKEAQVKISGNKGLKNGLNKIEIVVTSKDKTNTKKYVVNVTKTNNENNANADLETLAIENYNLDPEFYNHITNYKVEVSNDTEKLNILAIPSDMNARVSVDGNDNLKNGNNKIVITVTAANGITVKKYNIEAYKRNESEEIQYKEEEEKRIEEANVVLEQMSVDNNLIDTDKDIIEAAEDGTQSENSNKILDTVFMIVGIVLSLIVIGIVIIRIRRNT